VIKRRLKFSEEAVHSPRGLIRDECYLGRGVDVLNVYERCGHACSYCYVEWPWSPSSVVVRVNIVSRVYRDLVKRYLGKRIIINLGSATDPYQPIEAKYKLTRRVLRVLIKFNASFYICTKSQLILRDLDLLCGYENCWIGISIGCLNDDFGKVFEPYASSPSDRIKVIEKLVNENFQVIVRISPIIPGVNDSIDELRKLITELKSIGVKYIVAEILKLDRRGFIFYGWDGMPNWKRCLRNALIDWNGEALARRIETMYYDERELLYGYYVPNETYRFNVLKKIKELCNDIKFTTCNMGLSIKKKLSNWINDEERFMCACYARTPTIITLRGEKFG
ncbi:MAG: hypothetical protein DRJ21_00805, partial [Candidatus Methanomethylicota archaeon]